MPKIEKVFEAESLLTVPVLHHGETIGRLYVIASQRRVFEPSDITFLLQVFEHTIPLIDNIRLMDRLALDAVEMEHQRIARDLHDSVIQPYIGLQMGLAALRQKLLMGSVDIQDDMERVNELANFGIAELRRYMADLKSGGEPASSLVPAVQRFARKFTEATGIAVHLETASPIHVSDRLAAEILQMVAEGLSNVRRHTSSAWALIRLTSSSDHLVLHIENDNSDGMTLRPFTPRSLTERAAALGGKTWVDANAKERTIVGIDLPL